MNRGPIVVLQGGLGNQLFQFAAGLQLQKRKELRPTFSDLGLRVRSGSHTKRRLEVKELLRDWDFVKGGLFNQARFGLSQRLARDSVLVEKDPADDILEDVVPTTRYLIGYFQNLRGVDAVRNQLMTAFHNAPDLAGLVDAPSLMEIGIHARRGDYAINPATRKFHGLTDLNYFLEAAVRARAERGLNLVRVCSDDQVFGRMLGEQLSALGFETNGEPASSLSSQVDLVTLSRCKAIVMSNSSFSWWAAWAGSRFRDSWVVFPQPWFSSPGPLDDLLADNRWLKMERTFDV